MIYAIPIAGVVAVFNGLSSAFLAGRFPVAGGTYEYGYRALNPWLGFAAGWLFLLAKTASAATAALGIALYLGIDGRWFPMVATVGVTALVALGLRRTTAVNALLVAITIGAIVWFAISADGASNFTRSGDQPNPIGAIAFLFVAFTGYGRIATLGEEVRDPARIIPRAVVVTLAISAFLYILVELGGRARGGEFWGVGLEIGFSPGLVVRVGAVTAMVGVLVNLVLGLSRVWLAMGRRNDMPAQLAALDSNRQPLNAVLLSGLTIALVTLVGGFDTAWSFSAMTVLLYYGITNLAALSQDRSRPTSWLGLASCLFLSFFVPPDIWLTGVVLLAFGLLWKTFYTRWR